MNKIKSSFLYLAAFSVACLSSCSDDENTSDLIPLEVVFETHLHLDSSYPCFDGETRANQGRWENGDVIFISSVNADSPWRGKATYHAEDDDWTFITSRQLSSSEQGWCIVYYFKGGNISTDGATVPVTISIDERTAIFSGLNSTYSVLDNEVHLKAHLKPHTWRMAFSGEVGSAVLVKSSSDITVYAGLDLSTKKFDTRKKDIELIVGNSNYTDFFYGGFTDWMDHVYSKEESIVQIMMNGSYNFCEVKNRNLEEGQTGILYLPSSDDKKGWSCPEYVDLGLPSGTKWATYNVGASSFNEYGSYFAWGEIEPKSLYSWTTYKWSDDTANSMTKYCVESNCGVVDNRTILELEDDAAHKYWGGAWRMPTITEFNELRDECTWICTSFNGPWGYKVVGPNGNYIFLLATGYRYSDNIYNQNYGGRYWTSSLYEDYGYDAYFLGFGSTNHYTADDSRDRGFTIRPVYSEPKPTHEYVDLGLPSGLKWATCNVGASSPEEYGDYFAWGETVPKLSYYWDTYKWCLGDFDDMNKYCTFSSYGTVDNKIVLEQEDDAAYVNWGRSWRMPTLAELNELREECSWLKIAQNRVIGFKVTGPNGNSIFLPSAGYVTDSNHDDAGSQGDYWSSSLNINNNNCAHCVNFGTADPDRGYDLRYIGHSVRPVYSEQEITHEYVDLGLPSGLKWATCNVGANSPVEYGDYFAWGETEPKTIYDWSTYKWCQGSSTTMTKYCTKSYYGTVDNKTALDPEDDAAHVNWGGAWRMPTPVEQDELRNKCTWTWTTQNGVNGYKVTGPNGNTIFLPAAGYRGNGYLDDAGSDGYYWSSSLSTSNGDLAYYLSCDSGDYDWGRNSRFYGQSVRPVCQ